MLKFLAGLFVVLVSATTTIADPVEDFYHGKRISIIVGSSAGSAYDAYGRLVGRYLGRFLPGAPNFVVQDMPGAGGSVAANHLFNIAEKDGTVMAEFERAIPIAPLLESRKIENHFDSQKFYWLGSLNSEVGLIVAWHTAPQNSFQDLLAQDLLVGSTGPSTDFLPLFLNNVLGTKLKIVAGYPNSAEVYLAMEKGEVQGRVSNGWSGDKEILEPWLKDGKVKFLVALATKKSSLFPALPIITDFAKTAEDREVMELLLSSQIWGRPFALPPGVPGERAAAVRRAFGAMMRDKDFLAEAKSQKLDTAVLTGEQVESELHRIYASPQAVIERARLAIGQN
jgi:tripartite-type tricarboxylate transporter receptor subunit TctC